MDIIFKVLKETATKYKKHGKIPTLFIDGADILAKYQEELFKHTVHLANPPSTVNLHNFSGHTFCNWSISISPQQWQ